MSGSYSRFSVRSSVDLPDPDGPITAAVVPAGTSMSTPRSTAFGPNDRWMSLALNETGSASTGHQIIS